MTFSNVFTDTFSFRMSDKWRASISSWALTLSELARSQKLNLDEILRAGMGELIVLTDVF